MSTAALWKGCELPSTDRLAPPARRRTIPTPSPRAPAPPKTAPANTSGSPGRPTADVTIPVPAVTRLCADSLPVSCTSLPKFTRPFAKLVTNPGFGHCVCCGLLCCGGSLPQDWPLPHFTGVFGSDGGVVDGLVDGNPGALDG